MTSEAFAYRNGSLCAENVALEAIASAVGTPFYCYSSSRISARVRAFQDAFRGVNPLVAYSVKANGNLAVLSLIASEGAGADVVSFGELLRARRAGIPGERIVFSGVGKTQTEMAAALDENIHQFNVESEPELLALNEVALQKGRRAPIAFRVNPDVTAGGHEKISTGKAEDKFGVAWGASRALYARANHLPGIDVKGVDVHIGSQITALEPFEAAFAKVADLVKSLRSDGVTIERVDLGGGLGVPYTTTSPVASVEDYARLVRRLADPLGVSLIFEPGRFIVADAGALVARIVYDKRGEARDFLILDAAMNDLLRPALYDAHHRIVPIRQRALSPTRPYDVVGPVCETSDRFARQRELPEMQAGELVAILDVGAYGSALASQYNSRPLIPEVLVRGDEFAVVRRRPSYEEMFSGESAPAWRR